MRVNKLEKFVELLTHQISPYLDQEIVMRVKYLDRFVFPSPWSPHGLSCSLPNAGPHNCSWPNKIFEDTLFSIFMIYKERWTFSMRQSTKKKKGLTNNKGDSTDEAHLPLESHLLTFLTTHMFTGFSSPPAHSIFTNLDAISRQGRSGKAKFSRFSKTDF